MTNDDIIKLLEETAAKLGEHFDGVQILVTWQDGGITKDLMRGCGNWHARQNLAKEFITRDNAQEYARQIAENLQEPPEEWKVV